MTYKPQNDNGEVLKVALIGKGLTFDSGGYNLKAGAGSMIEMMKFDMGGCAAVLGSAKAVGQLKPKVFYHSFYFYLNFVLFVTYLIQCFRT
jgi:leucyl aminopeptidase